MAVIEVRTDDGRVVWTLWVTGPPERKKGDWWRLDHAIREACTLEKEHTG